MAEVRVRFAPSPTGALHIGGIRTALYNYLFAKKHNGKFILRIEDTDKTREVDWAEDYIFESLKWLGIEPDEGVAEGGPCGPYRQSERSAIYRKYADQLIDEGKAYYAFDSPEELVAMRENLKTMKASSLNYNAISRTQMKNSLTLTTDEVRRRINSGEPYVIRIRIPLKEEIRFQDMVRGWVVVQSSTLDDKVLIKSDGLPTYHLANIVDDHLMDISHVIRGEEWLPSAPLHVSLYKFLGWSDTMPQFAHLPLILKPDGNGKLSKRDAEKHGFPIFPIDWQEDNGNRVSGFREAGYLPEAFLNFIALLGWNPGGENEIFSIPEMVDLFSIEKVNKGGAKFDIQKAEWFNGQYLRSKTAMELGNSLIGITSQKGIELNPIFAGEIAELLRDRVTFTHELYSKGRFLFEEPTKFNEDIVSKQWTKEAADVLSAYSDVLKNSDYQTEEEFRQSLKEIVETKGVKIGKVMPALRLTLTGGADGPDLMGTMKVIGTRESGLRIKKALEQLYERIID